MNRRIWSVRRLAPLGVLALVAGAAGAQATGGGPPAAKPQPPPRAVSAPIAAAPVPGPVLAPAFPAPAPYIALAPAPGPVFPLGCRPRGQKPAAAPPSEALKDAFGILRRERTDDDALPARARAALTARGLNVVDPQSSRLLRADRRTRAWVVPVPDVAAASTVVCRGPAARGRPAATPREGLAVVAVGGAPAGGGGALRDLKQGLASATVDPCSGAGRDMLGISGIVPDGVEAVFVTAADGSATRADVHDNGYAFVLPRPRRPELRYVVWTGADGTPHVQALPPFMLAGRTGACGQPADAVRVTPDPWGAACGALPSRALLPARPPRAVMRAQAQRRARRAWRLRRGGRLRTGPAPAVPAPIPLPLTLSPSGCMAVAPPIFPPGRSPALAVPRAVPPRPRLVPPRAPGAPRAPRAPAPRPAPPRGP